MTRYGAMLSIFVLLSSICFSTASRAEGFFEMLFGGGRQHADSRASYVVAPPQVRLHGAHRHHVAAWRKKTAHFALRAHARHHRALAHHMAAPAISGAQLAYGSIPAPPGASEGQKCCSDAQDAIAKIMHEDRTLRPGDAYMSSDGLRVYEGDRAKDQEFVPVHQARALDKTSKARLAAVEKAPVQAIPLNPGQKPHLAPAIAPHAGNAPDQKAAKLNKESLIKTFNGRTIRFVGGYAS